MTVMEKIIAATVSFWSNKLREGAACKHEDPLISRLVSKIEKLQVSEEQLKAFETALAEVVALRIEERGQCLIHCDYDPPSILEDACEKAGISCGMTTFGWKSLSETFPNRLFLNGRAADISQL